MTHHMPQRATTSPNNEQPHPKTVGHYMPQQKVTTTQNWIKLYAVWWLITRFEVGKSFQLPAGCPACLAPGEDGLYILGIVHQYLPNNTGSITTFGGHSHGPENTVTRLIIFQAITLNIRYSSSNRRTFVLPLLCI
jgi:hypothetical protein